MFAWEFAGINLYEHLFVYATQRIWSCFGLPYKLSKSIQKIKAKEEK